MATTTTSATSGTGAILQSLGVGSGIDINSLVSQLVTAEMQPDNARIARESKDVGTQLTAVGQLKGALATFQSALNNLNSQSDFQVKSVTSSDEKTLTVTAGSAAAPGKYQVEVDTLAQSQQIRSTAIAGDGTATLGTGALTLTLGSKTFSINIDSAHANLNAIRDAINAASDNPGISATVIHGAGTSNLVLSSNTTGATNNITVATSGGDGGLSPLVYDASHLTNYTELQPAADATLKIAGVPVTSPKNTVTGAIDGVTLTLVAANPSTPVTLTVSNDTGSVTNRIQAFVSSYNTLQGVISKLGNYDAASQTAGPLLGDAVITGLTTQLRRALSNPVTSVTGSVNTLAALGITTNKDGTLSLDTTKLNTALSNNFYTVGAIFGASDGVAAVLSTYVNAQLASGSPIDSRNKTLSTRQKQITAQQLVISARQAKITSRYTAQFAAMDKALAQMQQTSTYLTQQFNTLAKISSSSNNG